MMPTVGPTVGMASRTPRTARTTGRAAGLAAAAALLGSAVLLVNVVLLGPPGLVVGSVVLAGVALFVVRARLGLPTGERASTGARPDPLQPYPAFRQIDFTLDAGIRSARLFDRALVPRLYRLAAAVLADRRGVDLRRDPTEAREILGADVWRLITAAPPSAAPDSDRGRRARDVALVLDRLEEL